MKSSSQPKTELKSSSRNVSRKKQRLFPGCFSFKVFLFVFSTRKSLAIHSTLLQFYYMPQECRSGIFAGSFFNLSMMYHWRRLSPNLRFSA